MLRLPAPSFTTSSPIVLLMAVAGTSPSHRLRRLFHLAKESDVNAGYLQGWLRHKDTRDTRDAGGERAIFGLAVMIGSTFVDTFSGKTSITSS
jgi:hypothetical protein